MPARSVDLRTHPGKTVCGFAASVCQKTQILFFRRHVRRKNPARSPCWKKPVRAFSTVTRKYFVFPGDAVCQKTQIQYFSRRHVRREKSLLSHKRAPLGCAQGNSRSIFSEFRKIQRKLTARSLWRKSPLGLFRQSQSPGNTLYFRVTSLTSGSACSKIRRTINRDLKPSQSWVLTTRYRVILKSGKSLESKGFIASCPPCLFMRFHICLFLLLRLIRAKMREAKTDGRI